MQKIKTSVINIPIQSEKITDILVKNEQSVAGDSYKNAEQVAKLQGELSAERDSRKEERFLWIIISFFLFDCFLFSHVSWFLGGLLFLFQITILLIFAKSLGIEYAIKLLKPLSNRIDKLIKKTNFDI